MTARNVKAQIDWKDFSGNTAIMPVCVRSPAMRGRNIKAQLAAMSTRVEAVHVVIIDTLDRYNFHMDAQGCLARADDWMDEHLKAIQESFDVKSVIRWEDVCDHPDFSPRLKTIYQLYDQNQQVRGVVDQIASYYLVAKEEMADKRREIFNYRVEKENSVNYLLEEFVGTSLYAELYDGLPEIYWGSYVGDTHLFDRNTSEVSLILPETLPVTISRLGASVDGHAEYLQRVMPESASAKNKAA